MSLHSVHGGPFARIGGKDAPGALVPSAIRHAWDIRLRLGTAAALLLVLVGACGGGQSEDEKVADAVRGYLRAAADRDGERACGLLTRRAQLRAFVYGRVHAGPDHPARACASVFERYDPLTGKGRLRRASISDVEVRGDRARARADGVPVRLSKVDGDWRLDVAGVSDRIRDPALFGQPG